jgi:hypothetical protein
MCVRTVDGLTALQMSPVFQNLFTHMSARLNATVIQGLERALRGSNVRNPFSYTGLVNFGLGTEIDTTERPRADSFTGRSIDGRKSKLFVFGTKGIGEGDMRVDITESAAIDEMVTFLNGANGVFLSISALQPVWHQYANVGYNDHWIKEYRKG